MNAQYGLADVSNVVPDWSMSGHDVAYREGPYGDPQGAIEYNGSCLTLEQSNSQLFNILITY